MTTSRGRPRTIPISRFISANLWLIILNVLIFAALGWFMSMIRSGTSVADATILLQDPFSVEVFDPVRTDTGGDPELFVNNQIAYLESTDFAIRVAEELGMPPTPESAVDVLERLSVSAVENSHLVELEFAAGSPEAAVSGMATVVEVYTREVDTAVDGPYDRALNALNSAISESDQEIDALQTELASLRSEKTAETEQEFRGLLDQIQTLRDQLSIASEDQIPAITAEINALATQANLLETQLTGVAGDPELTATVGRLNDALARQTILSNRRSELRVQLASAPSPVAATSLPSVTGVLPPSVPTSILAGALVGLLAGLAWAYWLSDEKRRRFIDEDEPRHVMGSPLLGAVLLDERSPVIPPPGNGPELFPNLRERLVPAFSSKGDTAILAVGSTDLDPTKSQVAINLALAGARAKMKTLLIDTDLENPQTSQIVSNLLGRPRQIGMAEILDRDEFVSRTIQGVELTADPMHFISSGKFNPTNPPGEGKVAAILKPLAELYDLIVIDLPQTLDGHIVGQLGADLDVVVAVRHLSLLSSASATRDKLDSLAWGQLGYVYTYRPGFFAWLKNLFRPSG